MLPSLLLIHAKTSTLNASYQVQIPLNGVGVAPGSDFAEYGLVTGQITFINVGTPDSPIFVPNNFTRQLGSIVGHDVALVFGLSGVVNDALNNIIEGNHIGTNAAGTAALGNTLDGISLNDASNNRIIGNVVSGNGINQDAAGINLESNDSNNIIAGNEIGTNAAGDAMLGNSLHGIFLGNGSSNNTIGGTTVNDRNVISGNGKFLVADFAT